MAKKIECKDGNAPWKIDSPEERYLAQKADESESGKNKYVEYYRENDPEYYEKGLNFIEKSIRLFKGDDSLEENMKKYSTDMVYSLHRFGSTYNEYFIYDFEHLNTEGRETFVTDRNRWALYDQLNLRENLEIFNNKKKAYDTFKKYYKRDLLLVESESDKDEFYRFITKHTSIIVKPYNGSGGAGISIIDTNDYNDREEIFNLITKNGAVVCEELIKSDERLAALHPNSVNTLRVPTLRIEDEVIIFHPYLRIGCGDSIVDNYALNRVVVPVDVETGVMFNYGLDKEHHSCIKHPDTGITLPGFQIPRWDEAKQLVTELAKVVKGQHYCGWDIALTDDGWIMVEGNPRGELAAVQYTIGRGVKKDIEEIIKRINCTTKD